MEEEKEKDRTKQYLAYGAGILVLGFLFALGDASPLNQSRALNKGRTAAAAGDGAEADSASKSGKSSDRPTASKPASDKEQEKFSRFFLPPIKLEGATIQQAVAEILAAYRETATATGETPLDLQVDLSAARTRKPLTTFTPRAPAGTVIRYVAVLAGNRTKGSLPNFRLEGLSDRADRSGALDVPPDFAPSLKDFIDASAKASEAKLGEDPFAPSQADPKDDPFTGIAPYSKINIRDLLIAQGFNPDLECTLSGSSLAYGKMSEAEQEWLGALLESTSRPSQIKTNTMVAMIPEGMELPDTGTALSPEDVQLNLRKLAQKEGVDLMTLPAITARGGQTATVELIKEVITPDGGTGWTTDWTGVKMVTTAVPYGLGSQVEFAFDSRPPDGGQSQARERITLPENGSGVAVAPASGGGQLLILQGNTMIDATGRPLGPPP